MVDYVVGCNHYMDYLISLGIYSFKSVKMRAGLCQRPFLIDDTSEMYKKLDRAVSMYICGCKDLWNYETNLMGASTPTKVDRNEIICVPIEIRNILNDEQRERGKEDCVRMTKYSLGIRT